jgi:hypothetical protein
MNQPMTRDQVLAQYRPMREAASRITGLAIQTAVTSADLTRAAKRIGMWSPTGIFGAEDDESNNMLHDIALFEPNQRGRLPFATFLQRQAHTLDPFDRALADLIRANRFSLFHVLGQHEIAGVWLEDILDGDRRLWFLEETLATPLPLGSVAGMRVFDAGPFHMGFGIVAFPDDETIDMSVVGQKRNGRQPFRYSLASTLYGDRLIAKRPVDPRTERIVELLLTARAPGHPET